jgi:hypothetical protein
LLRDKVTHEARTWAWANRPKTRLNHKNIDADYIEVGAAEGLLVVGRVGVRVQRRSKPPRAWVHLTRRRRVRYGRNAPG